MRPTTGLLLRLVCSIALLFSALPTRAGVVCVEGGRVVAACWMTSLPEVAAQPKAVAVPRMACCRPGATSSKAAATKPTVSCPAHKRTRCAYAYRSGSAAVMGSKAALTAQTPELVLALVPTFELPTFEALAGTRGQTFAGDSDPPRSRPRAPDRGRAPPVA